MLNEATADERDKVTHWLDADHANRSYFNQLKKIWDDSRRLATTTTIDENKAWQKFRQRIDPAPVRRSNFSWIRIAASILIITGIGLIGYLTLRKEPEIRTAAASQAMLTDTLPDGSIVTLNKESAISYPEKFISNTRKVTLNGEAFFNVHADRNHPFIVSVNGVQVTVTGTSFNIKTINGNTEVIVESGIVEVSSEGKAVELRANEKVLVSSNAKDEVFQKEKVTDRLYQFYRTKQFVCDDTPLWKLVDVINEAYHSKVVIGEPALRNLSITTTFNNESLDQVLNIISITFNIDVIKNGDSIVLKQ